MAEAVVEERQLLKTLRWYDGFVICLANPGFLLGSLGYSVTHQAGKLESLELRCRNWKVEPLQVTKVQSSFFDDPKRFPPDSAALDCALLMRSIHHEWAVREPFYSTGSAGSTKSRQVLARRP